MSQCEKMKCDCEKIQQKWECLGGKKIMKLVHFSSNHLPGTRLLTVIHQLFLLRIRWLVLLISTNLCLEEKSCRKETGFYILCSNNGSWLKFSLPKILK